MSLHALSSRISPSTDFAARRPRARAALILGVFLVPLFVFNVNLRKIAAPDTFAASLLPFEIWRGHGLTLDHAADLIAPPFDYSIVRSRTGHRVSFYPVVTPILAAPLYAPWALAQRGGHGSDLRIYGPLMEKLSASVLAAASVVLIFFLLDKIGSRRDALILTAAYAFATSTWSISSQGLWQHGTAELLLSAALLLLVDRDPGPLRLVLLGLVAGLITANRPSDVVFSAVIALLVVRRVRWRSIYFWGASAAVAAAWIGYNKANFHSILGGYGDWRGPGGYSIWMATNGLRGFVGLLLSNRGLLIFSPFLLLFLASPRAALRKFDGLGWLLLAAVAFLYLTATSPDWAGGFSYGPRLPTDALPVLVLAVAGPFAEIRSRAKRYFFGALLVYSAALQLIGVFCFPGGGSGSEDLGLWNVGNSSPVVALRSGLETPDFAYLVMPARVLASRLPERGLPSRVEFLQPLPVLWRARERRRIPVKVANLGEVRWSSLGGPMGLGALRLSAYWSGEDGGPAYASVPADVWLAASLPPGRSVERTLSIAAPNATGRFRLNVEAVQNGFGRFSDRGVLPLSRVVEIAPGQEVSTSRAVEWSGGEGPAEIVSGEEVAYRVGVRNPGEGAWPGEVSVSYHWVRLDGGDGLYNGQRTPVPAGLRTGVPIPVAARVLANVPPGLYLLQFDMVEENVAWFSNLGSEPLMLTVRVMGKEEKRDAIGGIRTRRG